MKSATILNIGILISLLGFNLVEAKKFEVNAIPENRAMAQEHRLTVTSFYNNTRMPITLWTGASSREVEPDGIEIALPLQPIECRTPGRSESSQLYFRMQDPTRTTMTHQFDCYLSVEEDYNVAGLELRHSLVDGRLPRTETRVLNTSHGFLYPLRNNISGTLGIEKDILAPRFSETLDKERVQFFPPYHSQ